MKQALGIDIGGSGVKGAIVDLERGGLASERVRYDTPSESHPDAVAPLVAQIVQDHAWRGPVGVTFPGIVNHGVVLTAANVDKRWTNVDAVQLFERATGSPVRVLNDADAAGVAEMTFGAGRNQAGVTIMITFGTGIGTAIFNDGILLPNTELGHLQIRGKDAEHRAAARIRKEEGLSWEQWAERVNEYLATMEFFFSPDLFIIGGGVSKKQDKFMHFLTTRARLVPAQLLNEAGIIGAAMYVADLTEAPPMSGPGAWVTAVTADSAGMRVAPADEGQAGDADGDAGK
jgi:polyphosphate glucokinase